MSDTILFIGILHAVPVLLVGLLSRNSSAVFITAIIMGAIGFITGSPAYIAFDLMGVFLGVFVVEIFGLTKKKNTFIENKAKDYPVEKKEKYNKDGYDINGYNSDGFNKKGFNKQGYDRQGFNEEGYTREGFGMSGYNKKGYDKDGYYHEKYITNNTDDLVQLKGQEKGFYVRKLIKDEVLLKKLKEYEKSLGEEEPYLSKKEIKERTEQNFSNKDILWNDKTNEWETKIQRTSSLTFKPIQKSKSKDHQITLPYNTKKQKQKQKQKLAKRKSKKKDKSCSRANFSYYNHCWRCKAIVTSDDCRCSRCGWFICSNCATCGCDY